MIRNLVVLMSILQLKLGVILNQRLQSNSALKICKLDTHIYIFASFNSDLNPLYYSNNLSRLLLSMLGTRDYYFLYHFFYS